MTIYVSFDVETTGTVPGLHSMISFGAIAHRDPDFMCLGHFEVNIAEMAGSGWDPDTLKWWQSKEQAQAFCITTTEPRWPPFQAMIQILDWLQKLLDGEGDCIADGPIVFTAYPASFDMSFLNYYMQRYAPAEWRRLTFNKDVGWSAMCIQTMAAMILNVPFLEAVKRNWPKEWVMENPMPHTALEDARTQSYSFVRMMQTKRGMYRDYGLSSYIGQMNYIDLIELGTDYTGNENADEPDGVDLGPTTQADLKG